MLGALGVEGVIVALSSVLAAAVGGGAVAWRRLTILGNSEREKLDAEKDDIIATAEERATDKALKALSAALSMMQAERDYLRTELDRTRHDLGVTRGELGVAHGEIHDLRKRVEHCESRLAERRYQDVGGPGGFDRRTE